jgi:hypothetical protein
MSPEKFAVAVAVAVFAGGAIGLVLQRILPESSTTGGPRDMIGAVDLLTYGFADLDHLWRRLSAGSDLLIILTFTGVGVRFAPRTLQPVARLKAKSAPQALSSVGPQLLGFIGKCSCQGRGSLRPSSGMNVSISV